MHGGVTGKASDGLPMSICVPKAYSAAANLQTVVDHHACLTFSSKATPPRQRLFRPQQVYGRKQNIKQLGTLWKQMFHYFTFNQEWFFQQYHKAKFHDSLRSNRNRSVNEALCKILAYSKPFLTQRSMRSLG